MLGEFLQSAAALLVCMAASPEGERVGIFSFAYPPSEFLGARDGGWGFRWIYTLGDCAFSTHASGAGGRFLRFRRSNFLKRGAGGRFLGSPLPSAAARLICMLKHPRQRGGLGILERMI